MTAFGEHELRRMDEAAIVYGPDALTLCRRIAERHDLVTANFTEALPVLAGHIDGTMPDRMNADLVKGALRTRGESLRRRNAEFQASLPTQPFAVAYEGLKTFAFLLHVHTLHVPEIFKGYTPVDSHPDWPKTLHADQYARFGYYEEPFIGFALEVDATEDTRFTKYSQLFIEALCRERVTLNVPAMRRQPLLN